MTKMSHQAKSALGICYLARTATGHILASNDSPSGRAIRVTRSLTAGSETGDKILQATSGVDAGLCDGGSHPAASSLGANVEAANEATAFATGLDRAHLVPAARGDGPAARNGAHATAAQAGGA